jgi:hypothetical protein
VAALNEELYDAFEESGKSDKGFGPGELTVDFNGYNDYVDAVQNAEQSTKRLTE